MVTTYSTPRPMHWATLLFCAVLVTLFLFFIDEGRYTLRGLEQPGNIVAMSLYFLGLCLGLFGVNALFEKRPPSTERTVAVLGLGTIAGVAVTILFFFCIGGFSLPS